MSNRKDLGRAILALSMILSVAGIARGQGDAGHPAVNNVPDMKFGTAPGMPMCTTGSVQNGDPGKGPSIILAKAATGCSVPWHWHTPNEHLMMVSGMARLEAKDGKSQMLQVGGFAMMPSRHAHRFRCISSCVFYVYLDAPYDIHYVDEQGNEMSPDDALKAVKEAAPGKVR